MDGLLGIGAFVIVFLLFLSFKKGKSTNRDTNIRYQISSE
jgi:hypothetical protein